MEGAEHTTTAEAQHLVAGLPAGIEDQRPARIRHKRHSPLKRLRIGWAVRRAVKDQAAPAFDRFRAGLSGELPQADAGGVILAACNDYYYWHYARAFVASIERAGEPQSVHLHLCEPQAAVLANIRELSGRLSFAKLTWTADDCRLAEGLPHRTIYYAASRFLLAPLVLERTGAPVLANDVDVVVLQPPWNIYAAIGADADLVIAETPAESKPTKKVLAGAIGFSPSPDGVRFARELARALAAIFALRPRYHIDQITIHYLLERVRRLRGLRVAAMPERFWDFEFRPDAVIWTAKGWTRKDSGVFQDAVREAEEFLVRALEQGPPTA